MQRLKRFALKRPFLFGLVLIVIYSLLSTLAFPVKYLFPETGPGDLLGDALAKMIIFLIFLWGLFRFGWLKASGFTSLGKIRIWGVVFIVLIYLIVVEVYAYTGDLSYTIENPSLASATLLDHLGTGLVEETMFRGFVLVAMVVAWGDTKSGQVRAILLSSAFFGVMHLFNLFVRPAGIVLVQAIVVSLPGILYAALTLTARSIWPAILIHWLTNAAVNIKLIGVPNFEETLSMWLIFAAGFIPLVVYSFLLIRKLPEPLNYGDLLIESS